jgi:hypothetical protein
MKGFGNCIGDILQKFKALKELNVLGNKFLDEDAEPIFAVLN